MEQASSWHQESIKEPIYIATALEAEEGEGTKDGDDAQGPFPSNQFPPARPLIQIPLPPKNSLLWCLRESLRDIPKSSHICDTPLPFLSFLLCLHTHSPLTYSSLLFFFSLL